MQKMIYLIFTQIFITTLNAQVCDSSSQACLSAPAGLLAGNTKASSAVEFLNWMIIGIGGIVCIFFLIVGANKLNNNQYMASFASITAAAIVGGSSYFAFSFIN